MMLLMQTPLLAMKQKASRKACVWSSLVWSSWHTTRRILSVWCQHWCNVTCVDNAHTTGLYLDAFWHLENLRGEQSVWIDLDLDSRKRRRVFYARVCPCGRLPMFVPDPGGARSDLAVGRLCVSDFFLPASYLISSHNPDWRIFTNVAGQCFENEGLKLWKGNCSDFRMTSFDRNKKIKWSASIRNVYVVLLSLFRRFSKSLSI